MNKLKIRIYGDKTLKAKAAKVRLIDDEARRIVKGMAQAMYEGKGVGLAAPQVGISKRIIIFDIGGGLACLINPVIKWKDGKAVMAEGCLSFPGLSLEVKRWDKIRVSAQDLNGREVELEAGDMASRVIQHEIDHLDGVLIIDRVHKKKLKSVKKELDEISREARDKG